jgi:amino-acid N-acetyltransferase
MLPRTMDELYDHLHEFIICDHAGECKGCVSLHVSSADLAEIRCLAVSNDLQKMGVGNKLVAACIEEAGEIRIGRIFALTYVPDFFIKFGFQITDKITLPSKIWTECVNCPKFPNCDEYAVIRNVN